MYGLGNWVEVAEHVGTKSKLQCIDHYTAVYMDSPCFPLPVRHFFSTSSLRSKFSFKLELKLYSL